MSWSLEDRDGQIYIYCKGSVQLQWGHVEKISAPFAELKGSQSGKKFQLLQITMRNHQFSAIFSKYNSSYSSFARRFAKIHDPKEFTEKVLEAVNQLSSKKAKSKTSESSKLPATNVQREASTILSCQITSVEKTTTGSKHETTENRDGYSFSEKDTENDCSKEITELNVKSSSKLSENLSSEEPEENTISQKTTKK